MDHRPLARRDGLVVKTVGDELLVYDLERHRAHSLNAAAAGIWRACDGRRAVPAIVVEVRREVGVPVNDAAVDFGLAALGRARLLAGGERPVAGLTRRQVLGRLGTAAALPLVMSIVAPTAAQAQSTCAQSLQLCPTGNCCPGLGLECLQANLVDPCPSGGPGCVCD